VAGRWSSDTHLGRVSNDDASWEIFEIGALEERLNETINRQRPKAPWSKQNNTGVVAGRVFAKIAEFQIQCQQNPFFPPSCSRYLNICSAKKIFLPNCQNIVTHSGQSALQMYRKVFI
jgi:hypothetical protein